MTLKGYKYKIEKYDQWLGTKKRADQENTSFDISKEDFSTWAEKHRKEFNDIALQKLSPYVIRINESLPYTVNNLKVAGKPKRIRPLKAINLETQEVLTFPTLVAAAKEMKIGKKQIVAAIKNNKPYKNYSWEKIYD